jgi:GNAT superfamily N-acetyltransferase
LSLEHLKILKGNLGRGYSLNMLDIEAAAQIIENYAIPIRLYFGSIENLVERGIGFCIMKGEKLVSVAYTPFPFIDDFEIQVYTENSPEYRRKGLGTIVSAALVEYGLVNNLVPHWDAANEASVKLALKLGYSNPKTWEAYYYKKED